MINAKEAKAKTKTDFSKEAKECLEQIEKFIGYAMSDGKYKTITLIEDRIKHIVIGELVRLGYEVKKTRLQNSYYVSWGDDE